MVRLEPDKLEKLRKVRANTSLTLRPTPLLRKTYTALDGTERPLTLRYYQSQMVAHLMILPRFVVGDDCGLGKCQTGDSLILTDRGLLKMGEIEDWSGMEPDTFRPLSRPLSVLVGGEARPVKQFYRGGVKPIGRVVTRSGFVNTGSLVHPLWVRRGSAEGWVRIQDIREGDFLCIERREMPFPETEPEIPQPDLSKMGWATQKYPVPPTLNPDLARLLAYVVGEGWTNHRHGFNVAQDAMLNGEVRDDIRYLIRTQLSYPLREHGNPVTQVSSTYLREYLRLAGVQDAVAKDKVVPWCVLQGTRASCQEFLRGLFEAEASVIPCGIEITSASEDLLRQVQVLLLRFGVVACRRYRKVKGRGHVYWRLTIFGDDAKLFQDRIGFVSTRKIEALSAETRRKSNPNRDVVPGAQEVFDIVRADLLAATSRKGANGIRKGSGLKSLGQWLVSRLTNIRTVGHCPSYKFIERVACLLREHAPAGEGLRQVESLLATRYFYDPVTTITQDQEEVFDIEVDHPDHSFVGNGFVNHNTIEAIAASCYLWEKNPEQKVLVLTRKSAVRQWASEFEKFTDGVKVVVCQGTPKQRAQAREEFDRSTGPTVLVMGHRGVVVDFSHLQDREWGVLVLDEASVVKSPTTQAHQIIRHIASRAHRVWGLTATLIKNNLVEGYGIYRVVEPDLFKHSLNAFISDYCVTQMINVGRGRKIRQIVGYRRSDIERFRMVIEPFYLGRPKHEVASELPPLTTKVIKVGMSQAQHGKYQEALAGVLEVGTGEQKEVTKLTAVTYCQEIANHLGLIDCVGESEKLDELIELLTEGELAGKKVIVYTRFERMVGIGIEAVEKAGVKCVRITGKEDEDDRKAAQDTFQNVKAEERVVWITTAGSDAINLQAAEAIVFYDTPFSAGDLLQTLGRMIRIGSIHDRVFALHLVCEGTVDERVMEIVERKMTLVEAVLGRRIKGDGDDDNEIISADEGSVDAIFQALRHDATEILSV